jgi:HSP20 family protein
MELKLPSHIPWQPRNLCGERIFSLCFASDNWRPDAADEPYLAGFGKGSITMAINTLTRWEPLAELDDLQSRLSNLFGRVPVRRGNGREDLTLADWSPAADITEDNNEYVIKAELPDVKKEDVKVTVENGVLMISGERKFEKEEKEKKYHRIERAYGSFVRSFTLPDDTDAAKVKAEFKDGVLTVHLPKSEQAKPKQVDVQVG